MSCRLPRQLVSATVVALGVVVAYLALLGWDQKKTTGADGSLHGPYEAWQVLALVLVVACLAVWAGTRHDALVAAASATFTLTMAWSIDAATDSQNGGLWPVGAVMVLLATFIGVSAVGAVASHLHDRQR